MNKKNIELFANTLNNMFPDAKTELYYQNNFQLLIAIIMSAQATDKQVNKINRNFFEFLKTPKDWIKLWIEEIIMFIDSVSFFNNKSKNIYKTCEILIEKYDSKIPKTIEQLIELPWVWIKTAKVFLSITQNAPYIWVDTHVHRVLNRIGFVNTKTPLETDKIISSWFTKKDHLKLHNSIVLFWRYHCTARTPKCDKCKLKQICKFYIKKYVA